MATRRRITARRPARRRNPAVIAAAEIGKSLEVAQLALADARKTVAWVVDNIGADKSTSALYGEIVEADHRVRKARSLLK